MTEENHQKILIEKFALPGFRVGQHEIIQSVLDGRDTVAVLPTGGGKSLCYQFIAVVQNGLVIVVSPLIALMKDQVESLEKRGIPAGCLYSGQDVDEKRQVFYRMKQGGTFLLYLSPERTQKEGFKNWLQEQNVTLFAIDEAHCVSQWGHDFRQEYSQLNSLKEMKPDIPVLALTASATPLVLKDIALQLGLQNPSRHVHGFYRPNLYYQVEACDVDNKKTGFVRQALRQNPTGRILVYCGTRKMTEELAGELGAEFEGVAHYHAGMSVEARHVIQEQYSQGKLRILVATNAFGMGIDHPDVRLVVHHNMPANIDALYQEMGRAGRDGRESTCLMLFSGRDKSLQSYFIQKSEAPEPIKRSRWNTLNAILAYADSGECRHAGILTYYKDSQRIKNCGHCDVCVPQSTRKIQTPQMSSTQVVVRRASGGKTSRLQDALPLEGIEKERFQLLREWRKQKADELDVPAFVIFSDRTLRDVARVNPSSLGSLEKIHGFGQVKLDRFGKEILAELGNF